MKTEDFILVLFLSAIGGLLIAALLFSATGPAACVNESVSAGVGVCAQE